MTEERTGASVVVCAYTERRWDVLVASLAAAARQLDGGDQLMLVIDHNEALLERARAELHGIDILDNTRSPRAVRCAQYGAGEGHRRHRGVSRRRRRPAGRLARRTSGSLPRRRRVRRRRLGQPGVAGSWPPRPDPARARLGRRLQLPGHADGPAHRSATSWGATCPSVAVSSTSSAVSTRASGEWAPHRSAARRPSSVSGSATCVPTSRSSSNRMPSSTTA